MPPVTILCSGVGNLKCSIDAFPIPDGLEYPIPAERWEMDSLPANFKRTKLQIEDDLLIISKMTHQGISARSICEYINSIRPYKIGQDQVLQDRRTILSRIKAKNNKSLAEFRAAEIDRLDFLDKEASDAWEASKQDQVTQTRSIRKGSDGDEETTTVERKKQVGDAVFLMLRLKALERRCKLLGLDAPVKTEIEIGDRRLDVKVLHAKLMERVRREARGQIIDVETSQKSDG